MSASTIYDVKVRYTLDDKAGKGAKALAGEMDRAGKSASTLNGALAGIGVAGAFMAGKKLLIDFNSEIDQMKIGMTTIINMQLKKPWEEASKAADGLFVKFQELAKKSPATTKDFMTMAAAITPVITSLGGGIDKIEKLTQGAVLAGIATGTRADVAALDIKQMLMGTVTERDMMAQQLISSTGMTKEAFNDLNAAARLSMTESLLQSPSLLRAADEFGASFAGQVAAFQDQLQISLGTVGRPLMAAMGQEVKRWNDWIEKHPRTIARISKEIGTFLKDSFEFITKSVGWLVEHRDTIMAIGKTFLVFKGASLATGLMQDAAKGIGNFVGSLREGGNSIRGLFGGGLGGGGITGAFGSLSKALIGASGAVPALALLATAASELWGIFTEHNNDEKAKSLRMSFDEALGETGTTARRLAEIEKMFALKTIDGKVSSDAQALKKKDPGLYDRLVTEKQNLEKRFQDPALLGAFIRGMDDARKKAGMSGMKELTFEELIAHGKGGTSFSMFEKLYADTKDAKDILSNLNETLQRFGTVDKMTKWEAFKLAFPDQFGGPNKVEAPASKLPALDPKTDVKVTIHRIEVASDDPDRFVFGMVNAFSKMSKNPTQAASAIGD
jgi:hypothetical protein